MCKFAPAGTYLHTYAKPNIAYILHTCIQMQKYYLLTYLTIALIHTILANPSKTKSVRRSRAKVKAQILISSHWFECSVLTWSTG